MSEPLARFRRGVGSLSTGLLAVIYPLVCEECGTVVDADSPLCVQCMNDIERADSSEVDRIIHRLDRPALRDALALWHFEQGSTIRRLQHQLKYGNRPGIGRWFGRALARIWMDSDRTLPDTIVPIPLHHTRFLERGYNQSEAIATGFSDVSGIPTDSTILVRPRATQSQTSLTRSKRQKNLDGVFACGSDVRASRLLVVDDVITTGATLNEAARTLLAAGAAEICAAAVGLAHT